MDAILDLAIEGVDVPAEMARGFRNGVKSTFALGEPLIATGSEYRFLRLRKVDGWQRCLFRVLSEAGLNYHDTI